MKNNHIDIYKNIKDTLKSHLSKLIFRKVKIVFLNDKNLKDVFYHDQESHLKIDTDVFLNTDIPEDVLNNNIEKKYSYYTGFTDNIPLFPNDNILSDIYFSNQNICNLDTITFEMNYLKKKTSPPLKDRDILCMEVRKSQEKKESYEAIKWFIVSNEFIRLWRYIVYDIDVEPKYLETNLFMKWKLYHQQRKITPSQESSVYQNFKWFRTERASNRWVHIYLCIYYLCKGIYPNSTNLPRTDYQLKDWDLPKNMVKQFIKKWSTPKIENIENNINCLRWNEIIDLPISVIEKIFKKD